MVKLNLTIEDKEELAEEICNFIKENKDKIEVNMIINDTRTKTLIIKLKTHDANIEMIRLLN